MKIKGIILSIAESNVWRFILGKVLPKIRLTTNYTSIEGVDYSMGYSLLEPGDILLSVDYYKFLTKLIGGEFSHAAVCIDKGPGKVEVAEMVADGYTECAFYDFCKETDRVVIMRVNDKAWSNEYKHEFLKTVLSFKGHGYNYSFTSHEYYSKHKKTLNIYGQKVFKSHYCSQMVTDADTKNILDVSFNDVAHLGVKYISPTGLFQAKNVNIIWDSKFGHRNRKKEKQGAYS
jgi:hypothetical protein